MKNPILAPKGLLAILADPRVEDFSNEAGPVKPGRDASECHDGYWVYLAPGWQWSDVHCVHEWTVADVVREFGAIRRCEPGCDCGWDRKGEPPPPEPPASGAKKAWATRAAAKRRTP